MRRRIAEREFGGTAIRQGKADFGGVGKAAFGGGSGQQSGYYAEMRNCVALVALALLAGGCEQMQPMLAQAGYTHDLGNFEVEHVGFVAKMPTLGDGYDGGGFLKLELASSRQLDIDYPTYWIGVASDYCPLLDDHNLIALGEFFEQDNSHFWTPSSDSQPVEKSEDGMYRYEIYVVRAYPPPSKTHDDYGTPQTGPYAQSEYDIISDENDLCLQIFGGDHYHVFARSSVIKVNYDDIRTAAIEAKMMKRP